MKEKKLQLCLYILLHKISKKYNKLKELLFGKDNEDGVTQKINKRLEKNLDNDIKCESQNGYS